jgi:hypothetical protein
MGYGKLAKGVSEAEAKRRLQSVMPSSNRKKHFQGKTPSVFIGSHNYPKVNTGVLSPQHLGSPEMMDSPKKWYEEDFSIEKIASLRTSLVNSKKRFQVDDTDKFLNNTQEVAMARKPVDVEVELEKKPGANISGGRVKPVSASGDVEEFLLTENPSVERKVEKAFYDSDLKAETAVSELYSKGVDNYKILQSMSTGMLGEEDSRELVPTRWSITATDDIISKNVRRDVKDFQELGQIEYYRNEFLGNEFHIFLIPGRWEYELIEMKRPGSVWNAAENTYIAQNYESFSGRTSYAKETAGAFYAARLGVLEFLRRRQRQSKVLILRDVKPEYWAPLGVWVIRETVRNAFKDSGREMDSFKDVKFRIGNEFKFLYNRLKKESKIIGGRQSSLQNF